MQNTTLMEVSLPIILGGGVVFIYPLDLLIFSQGVEGEKRVQKIKQYGLNTFFTRSFRSNRMGAKGTAINGWVERS